MYFEKIAAKRIATAGVQCGAIANNQIGGQAQNSAINALLKTLDRIARDLRKRLNYSKKKPLRPTVLTSDAPTSNVTVRILSLIKRCWNALAN
jgi:hypothetical protein